MRAAVPKPDTVWPTTEQLEQMGLVRCQADTACTTYVDPANVPARVCKHHQRDQPRQRQPRWRDR